MFLTDIISDLLLEHKVKQLKKYDENAEAFLEQMRRNELLINAQVADTMEQVSEILKNTTKRA